MTGRLCPTPTAKKKKKLEDSVHVYHLRGGLPSVPQISLSFFQAVNLEGMKCFVKQGFSHLKRDNISEDFLSFFPQRAPNHQHPLPIFYHHRLPTIKACSCLSSLTRIIGKPWKSQTKTSYCSDMLLVNETLMFHWNPAHMIQRQTSPVFPDTTGILAK